MGYDGDRDPRVIAGHLAEIQAEYGVGLREQSGGTEGLLVVNPRTVRQADGRLFATGRNGLTYTRVCSGKDIVRLWAKQDGSVEGTDSLLKRVKQEEEGALGKYLTVLNRDIIRYRAAGKVNEEGIVLGTAVSLVRGREVYNHRDLDVWFKVK